MIFKLLFHVDCLMQRLHSSQWEIEHVSYMPNIFGVTWMMICDAK